MGTRVKFTSKIKADHEVKIVVVRWDACKVIPLLRQAFVWGRCINESLTLVVTPESENRE